MTDDTIEKEKISLSSSDDEAREVVLKVVEASHSESPDQPVSDQFGAHASKSTMPIAEPVDRAVSDSGGGRVAEEAPLTADMTNAFLKAGLEFLRDLFIPLLLILVVCIHPQMTPLAVSFGIAVMICLVRYKSWLREIELPLLLLVSIAINPKVMWLWVLVVTLKPICELIYKKLPVTSREKLVSALPKWMTDSRVVKNLNYGAEQGRPFVLMAWYLFCAPFAIAWMGVHWIQSFRHRTSELLPTEGLLLSQNKQEDAGADENNFYHSRVFGIVVLVFFLSGLPALFSYAVYEKTGVRHLVENARAHVIIPLIPQTATSREVPRGLVSRPPEQHLRAGASNQEPPSVVFAYQSLLPWMRHFGTEPTNNSVFWVHFYLLSVASALSVLFFRAWFTFPLHFLSDEHELEITESGIKRKAKGWLFNVLTINRFSVGGGADYLEWESVKSLRSEKEGFTELYPLPDTAFKKQSLTYKILNKFAAFIDGLTHRANKGRYLVFSATEQGTDFGNNIKVDLSSLNREQRAKLYYFTKQWAPHAVVTDSAEEQLLGSIVLKNQRYTQLWFDILTSKVEQPRSNTLAVGDRLNNAEYTIGERLSSGGQATTYLAKNAAGQQCVLKEFILAKTAGGTLIESAREFEAEVSLLSQLDHPGIVKLQDFFSQHGRVYVVLEFIEGQALKKRISESGPLTEAETAKIAASLCEVLEYLHGCNPPIVHRDITAENIILQPDGSVKLIDFSLAVKQDGRRTTDSCAKQCFTPPEQFREEACPQSDVYALGATMYYMLTASTPKPISVSSPQAKLPSISDEMNAIVVRATQLDLAQRYDGAHWMKLDLLKLSGRSDDPRIDSEDADVLNSELA